MGKITPTAFIAVLCREMKWTYEEYVRQPVWFLELIKDQMQVDSEEQKKNAKSAKMKKR